MHRDLEERATVCEQRLEIARRELRAARLLILALAERVAAQSEILTRRAEKRLPPK